jgi:hypothetical protein
MSGTTEKAETTGTAKITEKVEPTEQTKRPVREWTLMLYFASDNPLAPSIVSQLKAIKDAGFHPEANVIAHFDPHTANTPVHIFDVNLIDKLKSPGKSQVGFPANNPFVRNLVLDKLWGDTELEKGETINRHIRNLLNESNAHPRRNGNGTKHSVDVLEIEFNPPVPPPEMFREQPPRESLASFLDFCQREYPARHYILFILGHGLVVGNDLFLLDEHAPLSSPALVPEKRPPTQPGSNNGHAWSSNAEDTQEPRPQNSLLLKDLGEVLRDFRKNIGQDSQFELVGFHSCSMSGLEVAYELQYAVEEPQARAVKPQGASREVQAAARTLRGTANYMLASQGPAFVGSWPYKQILIRVLNDLELRDKKGTKINVKEMLTKIFYYCLYNSHDFQLAGYSFDLCLCDLNKVGEIKGPLDALAAALIKGLADPVVKERILLAHWDAQSYWTENYIDLYDFCFCLKRRCDSAAAGLTRPPAVLPAILSACENIMEMLKRGVDGADGGIVVRSEFAGPSYQYSHGLSLFFPWSQPVASDFWDKQYGEYRLITEASPASSWKKFLEAYFEKTMRQPHAEEGDAREHRVAGRSSLEIDLLDKVTSLIFSESGQLSKGGGNDATGKGGGNDASGDDCTCPSIKNYPSSTHASPTFYEGAEAQ